MDASTDYRRQWDTAHQRRLMRAEHVDPRLRKFVSAHYGAEPDRIAYSGRRLSVLDVGCGTGISAVWLSERGWHVDAIDVSPNAIARARQYRVERSAPPVGFSVCDICSFPCTGPQYDLIVDIRSLENMPRGDTKIALRVIWRLLRYGGRFFSLTASDKRDDGLTECGVVRKPDHGELCGLLDRAGFTSYAAGRSMQLESGRRVDDWMVEAIR